MSDSDKTQSEALDDLERVLSSVTEELASWRRRALRAEAGDTGTDDAPEAVIERMASLEDQNKDLKTRISTAREKADGLLSRLHFLEEQVDGN